VARVGQTEGVRRHIVPVLAVAALVGCADDGPAVRSQEVDAVVEDSAIVDSTIVADGLVRPTQITTDAVGRWIVAELNGGERDGSGRVLRIDPDDPDEREVLVDGLLTPTGVAVDGALLWVMERRRLTVGPYDDPGRRTVVLDRLPFNGRSEGTLTAVADGGILFDTSGSRLGDRLVDGSGTLWYLAGPDAEPEPLATGFKHAYAHTAAGDGRWFVTEISDGRLDGEPPPDELVIAGAGDDFGYPRCIGDREPVGELGVRPADCASTPRSHVLFAPGSTPTSVAVAPWDRSIVLVALWNTGEVVAAPVEPGAEPHEPEVVWNGIDHPQHLLADGDRLLVTDHDGGRIVALRLGEADS
jgi:glucose/arabinose dehydrogenase